MTNIYVFVRGGVVVEVRSDAPDAKLHLIDYDNHDDSEFVDEEEFEIAECGKTYDEIEAVTEEVPSS